MPVVHGFVVCLKPNSYPCSFIGIQKTRLGQPFSQKLLANLARDVWRVATHAAED